MESKLRAYAYWYIFDKYGNTEYVYVIAVSEKQANYFWYNYLKKQLGNVYDYDITPCNVLKCNYAHNVGDVLGQNARI